MTEILSESIFESEHTKGGHGLFEMALISYETDNLPYNTSIWVYGEQGIKPPHFHVKIDDKYEFEIKFDNFHDLDIWRSKTAKYDWHNYKNVKKAIKSGLTKNNHEAEFRTNINSILIEWNRQNPNHRIDANKYLELYKKLKTK